MPEETKTEDFSAEILILEDMGVDDKKLSKINSLEAATKLIKYYENKAPKFEDNTKKMIKLKANQGTKPLSNPEDLNDPIKLDLIDAMNPLSIKRAKNARWNNKARVMMIFTEEYPNGRVF